MRPYALMLSFAAHAAVIGAAVFAGRNHRLHDRSEIRVPLYFEVVEAADAISSDEHAEVDGAEVLDESASPSSDEYVNELDETFVSKPDETFPSELKDGEMSGPNSVPFEEDSVRPMDEATESEVYAADDIGTGEERNKTDDIREAAATEADKAAKAGNPHTLREEDGARMDETSDLSLAQEERAQIVSDPVALNRIVPAYPRRARRLRHEGRVSVEIVVDADGFVSQTDIIESSGYRELDSAALSAVGTARFAPASKGGVSVCGRLRLTFEFRLK